MENGTLDRQARQKPVGCVQAALPGHQPHTSSLPCPLQAAKLKARLTLMEGWLQGSDCGQPWGPMDILQGEAPRGDIYQGHHVPPGTAGEQEPRGGLTRQTPTLEPFSLIL